MNKKLKWALIGAGVFVLGLVIYSMGSQSPVPLKINTTSAGTGNIPVPSGIATT